MHCNLRHRVAKVRYRGRKTRAGYLVVVPELVVPLGDVVEEPGVVAEPDGGVAGGVVLSVFGASAGGALGGVAEPDGAGVVLGAGGVAVEDSFFSHALNPITVTSAATNREYFIFTSL
jgi:hypothetical protein